MKTLLFIAVYLGLLTQVLLAQQAMSKSIPTMPMDSIYKISMVDEVPMFREGLEAMQQYIAKHFSYPAWAKEMCIQTTIYVSCVIDALGKPQNVVIQRGFHYDFDQEAVRIVQNMTNWQPALRKGKAVSVEMIIPIRVGHY
ncbi:MAG: energy transducer TonB [Chitinophagales bacterium]|jgi:protein TonB|nr:energy transducer TonB [Chitinophagales bacterium]HNI45885.1 energy transducer TonB [Chitinophagales bacterium]HNL08265.1 energy transducer TonB [Chitinophagales bacterium]